MQLVGSDADDGGSSARSAAGARGDADGDRLSVCLLLLSEMIRKILLSDGDDSCATTCEPTSPTPIKATLQTTVDGLGQCLVQQYSR